MATITMQTPQELITPMTLTGATMVSSYSLKQIILFDTCCHQAVIMNMIES